MINVNNAHQQGDANLIFHKGKVLMIDAGDIIKAREVLVPYLKKLKIRKVDHFFISHAHLDHYEGMEAIQNAGIKIKNIYFRHPPNDIRDCCFNRRHFNMFIEASKNRGVNIVEVSVGFTLPRLGFRIVYAQESAQLGHGLVDVNDLSLIMKWEVKGTHVLFTGDLNKPLGRKLAYDSRLNNMDILKVPHHGGIGIAPNSFFDNVNAELLMIPGPRWIYEGERGKQVRDYALEREKIHCVNGINGNIMISFDTSGYKLIPEKPTEYCSKLSF